MNMLLPQALVERIKDKIDQINLTYASTLERKLSMRTFLYTAVYWLCIGVYPYEGPGLIGSN